MKYKILKTKAQLFELGRQLQELFEKIKVGLPPPRGISGKRMIRGYQVNGSEAFKEIAKEMPTEFNKGKAIAKIVARVEKIKSRISTAPIPPSLKAQILNQIDSSMKTALRVIEKGSLNPSNVAGNWRLKYGLDTYGGKAYAGSVVISREYEKNKWHTFKSYTAP